MRVKILRQQSPSTKPYWETFCYDGPVENSVAGALDYINYIFRIEDIVAHTLIGRNSQVLFTDGWLERTKSPIITTGNELKGAEIEIRPLRKFPVIHDLIVDRTSIHENLKQVNVYIGEYQPSPDGDHAHQYAAAKCLKCGLCLEVCPNYVNGKTLKQRRARSSRPMAYISAAPAPSLSPAWTSAL